MGTLVGAWCPWCHRMAKRGQRDCPMVAAMMEIQGIVEDVEYSSVKIDST